MRVGLLSDPCPCPHQPPDARARALDCHCHSPRCLHLLYHFCYVRPPVHVTSIRVGRLVWRERGSSFASSQPPPWCSRARLRPILPVTALLARAFLYHSCSIVRVATPPVLVTCTAVRPYARLVCATSERLLFCKDPPWCSRARLRPILLFTALHAPRLVRVLRELGVSTTTTQPSRAPL